VVRREVDGAVERGRRRVEHHLLGLLGGQPQLRRRPACLAGDLGRLPGEVPPVDDDEPAAGTELFGRLLDRLLDERRRLVDAVDGVCHQHDVDRFGKLLRERPGVAVDGGDVFDRLLVGEV